MFISLTYVPQEISCQIDDMAGLLKKHNQVKLIEVTPSMITVDVLIPMGGSKRPFKATIHPDEKNYYALANWLGVHNLLRFYRRLARTQKLRAQLGLTP